MTPPPAKRATKRTPAKRAPRSKPAAKDAPEVADAGVLRAPAQMTPAVAVDVLIQLSNAAVLPQAQKRDFILIEQALGVLQELVKKSAKPAPNRRQRRASTKKR